MFGFRNEKKSWERKLIDTLNDERINNEYYIICNSKWKRKVKAPFIEFRESIQEDKFAMIPIFGLESVCGLSMEYQHEAEE